MMELLRELADDGRARSRSSPTRPRTSALCDKVVVMGRGGELCFLGPARPTRWSSSAPTLRRHLPRARRAAGAASGGAQFEAGTRRRCRPRIRRRRGAGGAGRAARQRARLGRPACSPRRYAEAVHARPPQPGDPARPGAADRARCIAGCSSADVFEPERAHANDAAQLLFLLVTTAIWLGAIDAAREIIKERACSTATAAGVHLHAYLLSKVVVLFSLAASRRCSWWRSSSRCGRCKPAVRRLRAGDRGARGIRLRGGRDGPPHLRRRPQRGPGHELHPAGADPAAPLRRRDRPAGPDVGRRPGDLGPPCSPAGRLPPRAACHWTSTPASTTLAGERVLCTSSTSVPLAVAILLVCSWRCCSGSVTVPTAPPARPGSAEPASVSVAV